MSEVTPTEAQATVELDALKLHADRLGITYSSRIGAKALSEKIAEYEAEEQAKREEAQAEKAKALTAMQAKELAEEEHRKEMTKLVRVRIACHNPNKREWDGEFISVGNRVTGQLKKFVPFNLEEGYHIPYMMLLYLREKKCQVFYNAKSPNGGKPVRKGKLIKEFAVEVLPDLTAEELQELKQRQLMAKGEAA